MKLRSLVAEESPSFRYLYYKVCENNCEWNEYVGAATLLYGQAESSECARHATTDDCDRFLPGTSEALNHFLCFERTFVLLIAVFTCMHC